MPKLRDVARITEDKEKSKNFNLLSPSDPNYGAQTNKIMEFIDQNPGSTYREIANANSKIQLSTISSTLYRLIRSNRLKIKKLDFMNRYYPKSFLFADEIHEQKKNKKKVNASKKNKTHEYVENHPGCTSLDIKSAFNVKSLASVNHSLRKLVKKKYITVNRDRKTFTYYPNYPKSRSVQTPNSVPIVNSIKMSISEFLYQYQLNVDIKDYHEPRVSELVKWLEGKVKSESEVNQD